MDRQADGQCNFYESQIFFLKGMIKKNQEPKSKEVIYLQHHVFFSLIARKLSSTLNTPVNLE